MDDVSDWTDLGVLSRRVDYVHFLRGCPGILDNPSAAQQLADALNGLLEERDALIARIASRAGIGTPAGAIAGR